MFCSSCIGHSSELRSLCRTRGHLQFSQSVGCVVQIIKLHFSHLSLWDQSTSSSSSTCSDNSDRVIIEEPPSTGLKPHCATPAGKTLTTKTNQLLVRFTTNSLGDEQGFRAFYSAGTSVLRIHLLLLSLYFSCAAATNDRPLVVLFTV